MKTTKVSVNKSAEKPDGVEIEVVEPESELEQQVLTYLLGGFVRDAKERGTFKIELPDNFSINYQREGSFLLSSGPQGPSLGGQVHTYYTPAKPLAVLAIHNRNGQFDVVYGEIAKKPEEAKAEEAKADAPADEAKADAKPDDADKAEKAKSTTKSS